MACGNEETIARLREDIAQAHLTDSERWQAEQLLVRVEQGDCNALPDIDNLLATYQAYHQKEVVRGHGVDTSDVQGGGFEQFPGKPFPLPPGPRFVCPVEHCHYSATRDGGQVLQSRSVSSLLPRPRACVLTIVSIKTLRYRLQQPLPVNDGHNQHRT